ncbi:MAG: HD domain-containing protein [Chloroflexota bacterium]|nr:HD domain-containing protein [Chloroflexota bacterium]
MEVTTRGTSVVENLVAAPILRTLAAYFTEAGYELYLVGGSVRDALLHRPTHDLDLATDAHPPVIKRLLAQARPDSRYDVGEKFGTIGATFGEWVVEVTTYRSEEYAFASRKPAVTFGTSLEEDLSRRDFTINAIAQEPATGGMLDPFHGLQDLQRGLIRAVGDPAERFREDPLRMLRAVRFAAELGFRIDPTTRAALELQAGALEHVSTERIAAEMTRLLVADQPALGLEALCDTGLAAYVMPELLPLRSTGQDGRHKDVFGHTLKVVENVPATPILRWAALLHDIGKPRTKTIQDGKVHFFRHEMVGARMARKILRRLRFDRDSSERIQRLVAEHLRPNLYTPEWTDGAVRRFLRETEGITDDLFALSRADITSYRRSRVEAGVARVNHLEARCRELQAQEDVAKLQSPLDGNDLMTMFDRGPGPWIKPIKDYLLELVIDGELAQDDRKSAVKLAQNFANQNPEVFGE